MKKAAGAEAELAYLEAKKAAVADEINRMERQLDAMRTAVASSTSGAASK